jgi:hypothetical protein
VATYHQRNSRYKGAERRYAVDELTVADKSRRFPVHEPIGFEWHAEETHPRFGTFRWTGPSQRATVSLPVVFDRPLRVRIHVLAAMETQALKSMRLFAQSQPVEFTSELTPDNTHLLTFSTQPTGKIKPHDPLSVTLELDATRRPMDVRHSEDRRWLGVAVNWVEVGPALP